MNTPPKLVVVKVGGSLYDHPRLGEGLRSYLAELDVPCVVFVPGGGSLTDAVREFDRIHKLGEERSHWLALAALWTTAQLLKDLLQGTEYVAHPACYPTGHSILDSHSFCMMDRTLPESWEVTTDSIALRAAVTFQSTRLILLKSTDIPPGTPWPEAAARGWVDAYFPTAVADATFPIEAINFRKWLDERFPAESGG